jgi:hypothetical protein
MQIDNNILIFRCLYCNEYIEVSINEINCQIFRHAIDKVTYQQINPHATKDECDKLIESNSIYGCCKPFKINVNKVNNIMEYTVVKCDYI